MLVWVLMRGEYCEGGTLLGIYASRNAGLDAAADYLLMRGHQCWHPVDEVYPRWENNGDWLALTEHNVEGTPEKG